MNKHSAFPDFTTLLNGGGIGHALARKAHELLNTVLDAITQVGEAQEDIDLNAFGTLPNPKALASQTTSRLNAMAISGAQELAAAYDRLVNAKRHKATFELQHGLTRKVRIPDPLMSALLFIALGVIEGILTSIFFLDGGFVAGIGQALGLGLSISGINVVVAGLIGGGVFGRYWNYGLKAMESDSAIARKRFAGRVGSILTALVLIGLLLASGILRASGEPEHLSFTFENIGAAATNFHSLLLWALGLSLSILSWIKGLSAFSDPYPGFVDAAKEVMNAEKDIHQGFEETSAEINETYEDALDDLDDMSDEVADIREDLRECLKGARSKRGAALSAIARAPSEFAVFLEAQSSALRMVNPGDRSDQSRIEQAFRAELASLRNQVPELPEPLGNDVSAFEQDRKDAEAKINQARFEAVQTINEAYRRALSQN